jgi:hypothetical protein
MSKRSLLRLCMLSVTTSATVLALSAPVTLQERFDGHRDRDDNRRELDDDPGKSRRIVRLPTGQYVTPTAISEAVQQYLNPRLPAYPDFIAGEAVRSQLSPDGTTLAERANGPCASLV